ncbi:septation protein SepH, partial [uncultured Corynebacterium sp.]|uniref:septation protein SepH n=1 Tax=uncultured Corynebacterium sp. TaxID=159447 RepID=UPI00262B7B7D
ESGAAAPDAPVATTSDGAGADAATADAADAADGSPAPDEVGATGDSAKPGAGAGAAAANVGKQGPTAVPEPDKPSEPRLILRPREIQDRVRAGASVAELVELTGMPQRRIEPFAHPVLAERARIAELGKQSRPRRSEGPAQLPLRDVLATAFAARGQDISEAEWDAWRDLSGQWIIGVTWTTGHSTTTAEYAFYAEGSATSTVARNTLAAELVDPDFARPRRSLSPVGADGEPEPRRIHPIDDADAPADAGAAPDSPAEPAGDEADEDFMRHPDDEPAPRRRRKTVMPSWEDVLLGVRPTDRK